MIPIPEWLQYPFLGQDPILGQASQSVSVHVNEPKCNYFILVVLRYTVYLLHGYIPLESRYFHPTDF